MAFISSKIINGKKRFYIEESVRLIDGKVKKVSVYLKDYGPKQKEATLKRYRPLLKEKIKATLVEFAIKHYKTNEVFDKHLLKQLEEMRIDYKDIITKLTKNQLRDIIDRFTINFTYESNAIEGNSLTIKDVTMVLQENKTLKGKDLREIYETINTRKAMDLIFNKKLSINKKDIIKLHKILVQNTGVSFGYKTIPNFLVGRNIKLTPPEKVPEEMEGLIRDYHENKDIHPLQKAAAFHGKFERIHPFEDGNGRVGRLLINIMLLENGYPRS